MDIFVEAALVDLPFVSSRLPATRAIQLVLDDLVGHDVDHPSLQRGFGFASLKVDRRVFPVLYRIGVPHRASELL